MIDHWTFARRHLSQSSRTSMPAKVVRSAIVLSATRAFMRHAAVWSALCVACHVSSTWSSSCCYCICLQAACSVRASCDGRAYLISFACWTFTCVVPMAAGYAAAGAAGVPHPRSHISARAASFRHLVRRQPELCADRGIVAHTRGQATHGARHKNHERCSICRAARLICWHR